MTVFLNLVAVSLLAAATAGAAAPEPKGDFPRLESAAAPSGLKDHREDAEAEAVRVVIPADRPDWVEADPVREGEIHQTAVSSGPYYTRRECLRALDEELKNATDEYINWWLDDERAAGFINYDLRDIKAKLVRSENRHDEVIQVSFGPMHQSHALLEFDGAFRRQLEERWRQIQATSRLLQTGLAFGAALGLLALLFGYFKLDTATRGCYSGRLQFVAAVAILALAAAGVLLAQRIPWM